MFPWKQREFCKLHHQFFPEPPPCLLAQKREESQTLFLLLAIMSLSNIVTHAHCWQITNTRKDEKKKRTNIKLKNSHTPWCNEFKHFPSFFPDSSVHASHSHIHMYMVFYPADSLSSLQLLKHLDASLTMGHLTGTLGPISVLLMYAFCLSGCLLNFFSSLFSRPLGPMLYMICF